MTMIKEIFSKIVTEIKETENDIKSIEEWRNKEFDFSKRTNLPLSKNEAYKQSCYEFENSRNILSKKRKELEEFKELAKKDLEKYMKIGSTKPPIYLMELMGDLEEVVKDG